MDYCLFSNVQPVNSVRDHVKNNKTCSGIFLHYVTVALYMIYSKSKDVSSVVSLDMLLRIVAKKVLLKTS